MRLVIAVGLIWLWALTVYTRHCVNKNAELLRQCSEGVHMNAELILTHSEDHLKIAQAESVALKALLFGEDEEA